MQLGPFQIDHPFILAPMAGITNSPFRRLMRRMGSSMVVSELVSANGMAHAGVKTLEFLRFHEEERPIGIQIFGENLENLLAACRKIEAIGADFVDLNLGCPVPKVVKKGAGSAMCRDVPTLGKILEAMVHAVKIPVSIKIRTGWDADSRNAIEVARMAGDVGVRWIAIHGRTRAQGYSGEADWDYIGEVKAKSSIPVIGNGDLVTPQDAVERVRKYGVDAVMIGRGALRNPFLFEQARAVWGGGSYERPTAERYVRLIEELTEMFKTIYNERMTMIHSRKFLAWFSSGFPGCHEFRRKVFSIPEADVLWAEAREFFQRSTQERDMRFLSQPFLMGGHG